MSFEKTKSDTPTTYICARPSARPRDIHKSVLAHRRVRTPDDETRKKIDDPRAWKHFKGTLGVFFFFFTSDLREPDYSGIPERTHCAGNIRSSI